MDAHGTDTPPSDAPAGRSPRVQMKVRKPDGTFFDFSVSIIAQFQKIMRVYRERLDMPVTNIGFQLNGREIHPLDTPTTLGIEDGAVIDAVHLL